MNEVNPGAKLLIVSSWAPPMTGGPQNLYNLLSQFPPNSYCILTSYEAILRRTSGGKWLGGEYIFYDHAGRFARRPSTQSHGTHLPSRGYASLFEAVEKLPRIVRYWVSVILQAVYLLRSISRIVRTGVPIVRQKKIDCVMGISDVGTALISSYVISRRTKVPYVVYLFDIYGGNRLTPLNDLFARIFEPRIFRHASLVIVTNEGTERFYRKRYGDSFRCEVVHNSVFPEKYEGKRTSYAPQAPYDMVFTGHVYWAQERSLMNLLRALEGFELPLHLHLYVPVVSQELRRITANLANVHLVAAPQSKMPDIQCRATLLFLPLSWRTRNPDVIATATPGKLADYLASGRPIIIHAPSYAYVSNYARQEGFAHVVDDDDIQELRASIRKLILDVKYSRGLIKNAKTVLKRNHDATVNARRLASLLRSLHRGSQE